jgi:hypothetical protein
MPGTSCAAAHFPFTSLTVNASSKPEPGTV